VTVPDSHMYCALAFRALAGLPAGHGWCEQAARPALPSGATTRVRGLSLGPGRRRLGEEKKPQKVLQGCALAAEGATGVDALPRRLLTCAMGLALGYRKATQVARAEDAKNRLLEENSTMKALRSRFMESQSKLESAAGAGKTEAVERALDTILEFFESSNKVWNEIGPLAARERDVWVAIKTGSGPKAFEVVNFQFLTNYYAFWKSFNSFFDCLISTMDNSIPREHDLTATPRIDAFIGIEKQDAAGSGKIARLESLFLKIQDFRKTQVAIDQAPINVLATAAPIISSFCQDGEYNDGLGSLIDIQGQLLQDLRSPDVRAAMLKRPSVAKALRIQPDNAEGVVTHRALELLFQSQGVFLFVNNFQEQVVQRLVGIKNKTS